MTDQPLTLHEQIAAWDADRAPRRRRGDPPAPRPPAPPGRLWLDPGRIACASCGQAVHAGADGEFVRTRLTTRWIGDRPAATVTLGTCPGCASLDVHARMMLPPNRRDTDAMALSRLLIAWRVVGQPLPDRAKITARDVQKWFGHLSLDWAGRLLAGTESGQHATTSPFGHVTPATRAAIRLQFARWQWVRARPGQPLSIKPPTSPTLEGRGCLMCGIDHVDVPPGRIHDAAHIEALWRPVSASPQALGGVGGKRLHGYICPACTKACDSLDGPLSIGPSSLERALATHWAATGHPDEATALRAGELAGAVGWGALPGRAPNSEPWSHMAVPTLGGA